MHYYHYQHDLLTSYSYHPKNDHKHTYLSQNIVKHPHHRPTFCTSPITRVQTSTVHSTDHPRTNTHCPLHRSPAYKHALSTPPITRVQTRTVHSIDHPRTNTHCPAYNCITNTHNPQITRIHPHTVFRLPRAARWLNETPRKRSRPAELGGFHAKPLLQLVVSATCVQGVNHRATRSSDTRASHKMPCFAHCSSWNNDYLVGM
jgi:hypothetical protein